MDDLSFIATFADGNNGNATLKVLLPDGQVCHISDCVSPYKLLDRCPLLYHAFEYGFMSRLQASIEAPSASAVISLLRFCYTGNYLPPCTNDASCLLLDHAETYKIAEDFQLLELQLLAHGNFECQIDFACCRPSPPQDLLETIRFIYKHFTNKPSRLQHALISTLCNYCIAVFLYHKLGEEEEFLKVVREIPEFCQDLCRTNMERDFQDECAFNIIRLSLDLADNQSRHRPTILASRDLPEEMMYDGPLETAQKPEEDGDLAKAINAAIEEIYDVNNNTGVDSVLQDTSTISTATTLVYRPKTFPKAAPQDVETDPSSDEEGFSFVRRPKPLTPATPDDVMSSPELVPAAPMDVLAATGSDYPSDDDWSMI